MGESTPEALKEFFQQYPAQQFCKKDIILDANETPGYGYFIEKGIVRQFDIGLNGSNITLNVLGEGSFLSLTWVIGEVKNRYYFQAHVDTILRRAPIADIQNFIFSNPDVMADILRRVSRGLDGFFTRLSTHMLQSADNRLALEILIEARRFGRKKTNCEVKLSVNELASRTGLARETASRQLGKLLEKSLVKKRGHALIVPDVKVLEAAISNN